MKWIKDKTATHDRYATELVDVEGWYHAYLRRNGCMEVRRYFNRPCTEDKEDFDQIHICDIDDFIERLIELKKKAIEYFGEEYPY